jgi:hypothetical protein
MDVNFIYFTSWIMHACFSGYAHVSQAIWLNCTQDTKKYFKLQEYELKLNIFSLHNEALVETIKMDKKAKTAILSNNEINMKHYLKERLATLLREEEIKLYERAKVQNLLRGEDNTHFFHLIASDKRRKQHIFRLEQEDETIVGDNKLKSYITRYYKNLFGKLVQSDISLHESRIDDIPHVTEKTAPFTMGEIKEVAFQMEHNKAP